jgi:hypothetical protein
LARGLTEAERKTLDETVKSFVAARIANDADQVVEVMSPRFIAYVAQMSGLWKDEVRRQLATQLKNASDAKIEALTMDLSKADYNELPDGTPYVLVPTETVIRVPDGRHATGRSHTLALIDEGWRLFSLESPDSPALVQRVFPEFAGVQFPRGSYEGLR